MLKSIGKFVGCLQATLCIFLVALPVTVSAQWDNPTVTPVVGYRFGGNFEDEATGKDLDVDQSETLGLIVGWDVGQGQFEVSYTRQSSDLDPDGTVSPDVEVDVDITNLMVAGKLILDPESGGYLSFLLGLTEIDLDASEFDSYVSPALGLEGGLDYRIDESFGIRFGIRGIASVLGTDSRDLCDSSSNCPIRIDNSKLVQYDVFTGLSFRF